MPNPRVLTLLAALAIAPLAAACGTSADAASTETTTVVTETELSDTTDDTTTDDTTTDDTTTDTAAAATPPAAPGAGMAGGVITNVDASSVSTEAELIALIQSAYGDAGLGLHRGHQPVEAVLIDTLGITHDEMHVRMETQGQNLSAIAEDLGVGTQTLIDALVESWSPAIDGLLADGTITEDQAAAYLDALTEAFTYRVTWNGSDATPTFAGI